MKWDPYERFKGHLDGPDPRSVTTGAGGCTWPTVPAFRYLITSDNPSGPFTFLSTVGLLIEAAGNILDHNILAYNGPWNDVGMPGVFCWTWKLMLPDAISWSWVCSIKVPTCVSPVTNLFGPYTGKCNVDVILGNMPCAFPSVGETGSDLQMRQVEWNQPTVPYPWP